MFPKRSIKNQFIFQILVASATLLIIFSSILYVYIQQTIYDERKQELIAVAQKVKEHKPITQEGFNTKDDTLGIEIDMVKIKQKNIPLILGEKKIHNKIFLRLYYPYDFNQGIYIRVTKDFSTTKAMLGRILHSIFVINALSFLFIIFYAIVFGNMLIAPVKALTEKLSKINEHFINPIDLKAMPIEFLPLGEGINSMIKRIQTFVKYQKELFIGAAHELKTPLAVIKLKNEVTLIKKREASEYIEAIEKTNEAVNGMNRIIADILNVGRQEGAQFEKPIQKDLIQLIQKKAEDFQLIANSEHKQLRIELEPSSYIAQVQPTLIGQIIQNFLQNALKFTPEHKEILLKSTLTHQGLVIQVIDEGCGIDESMDIFAPFKRAGNQQGAGLGLFLAKSAADALHAHISLENRKDGIEGTVATLILNSTLSCILPKKSKKIK